MDVAIEPGIEIDPREPAVFRGIADQQAKGFYGKEIALELKQGKTSYRWVIPKVAFLYHPPEVNGEERIIITLGHVGFFRYFNVSFDNQRARVEIRPNGLFQNRPT
jgi:hypothetical protein